MSKHSTQPMAEPGQLDFFITRVFAAEHQKVFAAFSQPDLLQRWFMPKQASLNIHYMTCQTGGAFHMSHQGPQGAQFGFRGVYHEVLPHHKIIKTSEFEGLPQKLEPVLEITTFESISAKQTKVTIHTLCPSAAYRDAMIQANMEPILQMTHGQLDELLAGG